MAADKVLVFGASGSIGSLTAREAQRHGAAVTLAMRDPQKAVPGLTSEQELAGGFQRLRADLADPVTVRAAVQSTAATRAFIYIAFDSPDHMRATIEALTAAGIEYIVFLSSLTFQGHPRDATPAEIIAYAHAQVELNLAEVMGPHGFVAVRPGYFASNNLRLRAGLAGSEVRVAYPDVKFDWIAPEDIGETCGRLLASGRGGFEPTNDANVLKLCGAAMLSQRNAVAIIAKTIGKELRVAPQGSEQGVQLMVENGIPEPIAKMTMDLDETTREAYTPEVHKEGGENVRRYTGHAPRSFQQWVERNAQLFKDW